MSAAVPDDPVWILYQRDDCHLCDLALEVLAAARFPEFESVFIDDDADLEAQWGTVVPVLRHVPTGAVLCWPFNENALREFWQGVDQNSK
ncbi:glutaredoxin family protein [Aquilutibacter rugosus]|uniref:glutaredoxin family protein n=1 Tax=Aquilutibacter rugosus TaxID=3115820 RepID=UPI002F3ED330